ncbi:hypothetical protein BDV12DRAFT_175023 [Aspergillus spectabilis]
MLDLPRQGAANVLFDEARGYEGSSRGQKLKCILRVIYLIARCGDMQPYLNMVSLACFGRSFLSGNSGMFSPRNSCPRT